MSIVKNIEFIILAILLYSPTSTTFNIFVIIILYSQLSLDKYLLFLEIILDFFTRVSDYLDTIISCLVNTVLPNWNIFQNVQYSCYLQKTLFYSQGKFLPIQNLIERPQYLLSSLNLTERLQYSTTSKNPTTSLQCCCFVFHLQPLLLLSSFHALCPPR